MRTSTCRGTAGETEYPPLSQIGADGPHGMQSGLRVTSKIRLVGPLSDPITFPVSNPS